MFGRHHHPQSNSSNSSSSSSSTQPPRSFFFCKIVLYILALLFCVFIVLHVLLTPKTPTFIIHNLSLKYSSPPENNSDDGYRYYFNIVTYNLSMEVSNPNSYIGFYYVQGGSASLSYNEKEIAHGTPPEFYNRQNEIRVFYLDLESMKENNGGGDDVAYSNGKIPFVLFIRSPVKMKVGKLKLGKKMEITCDIIIPLSSSLNNNVDLETHYCKSVELNSPFFTI